MHCCTNIVVCKLANKLMNGTGEQYLVQSNFNIDLHVDRHDSYVRESLNETVNKYCGRQFDYYFSNSGYSNYFI